MAEQGSARRPFCELIGQQSDHASTAQERPGADKMWRGGAPCTLRDLCAEDKRKVAKLIRQVVEAEQRVQALTAQAQEEAAAKQRELEQLQACSQKAAKESADLRAKLSHALALLRAYQSRLRAAHAPTAAAPALLARPGALGAAGAPTASAPPALPAPRAASEEVWSSRSAAEGHCPTCCQRVAGTGGSAGDRVRADANPAAAPPHPDALTDLAASLLAWQLRRGGASLEWLGSAPRGQGSEPEPASASMRALPQSVAGAAGGGRALRFDPASGRSGAFVYEDAAEPTGSQATSRSTAAACAPATADNLPGSGAGQHSGGSTGSRGQGGRRAAAAADPTAGEAGAQGAAHVAAPGAVLADRRGGSSCQVAGGAAEGAAGGEARRWAGSSVAGSLATGAAGSGQRPGPAVGLPSAVDAPWQHAHAADEREGLQAAVHAEAVQTQLRKQPAKTNALAARGASARAPAETEPDLDASLIDLVAEVERLQAGAEALSRGTPSPKPGSKPSKSCQPQSPRTCARFHGPENCRQWVYTGGDQLGGAWDSSSLFEENDVVSLISEQDWDM